MIQLHLYNETAELTGASRNLVEQVATECQLKYDYWTRRRGTARPKMDSRTLEYFNDGKFPAGWASRIVKNVLSRASEEFEVVDHRQYPAIIDLQLTALPNTPWDHQQRALKAAQDHEIGIIQVPTRGGKTLIMGLCASQFSVRTLILVPNKLLLTQEYEVFSQIFGEERVGRVGGGFDEYDKPVIVATVQTMNSRIKQKRTHVLFQNVGCLLIDECHHIKHGGYKLRNTYFEICQRFVNARYRLGFTATPGKTHSIERRFLEGCTGEMIFSEDISTLTEAGIITPAKVLLVPMKLPKTRTLGDILIEDHGVESERGVDIEVQFKRRNLPVPIIPTFGQQLTEKVTENPKFRELVKDLAEYYGRHLRKSVIVAVSRVEEGVIAFTEGKFAIDSAIGLSGKDKDETRESVLKDFRTGKTHILVSTLLREGIDLPKADVLIMAGADVKSATPVIQRAGRVLTRDDGKELAIVIDFYLQDKGTLRKHSRDRAILYEEQGWELELLEKEELAKMRKANLGNRE